MWTWAVRSARLPRRGPHAGDRRPALPAARREERRGEEMRRRRHMPELLAGCCLLNTDTQKTNGTKEACSQWLESVVWWALGRTLVACWNIRSTYRGCRRARLVVWCRGRVRFPGTCWWCVCLFALLSVPFQEWSHDHKIVQPKYGVVTAKRAAASTGRELEATCV